MRAIRAVASCSVCVAFFSVQLTTASLREARADTVDECVAAASSGQKLQHAGELRAARAAFLTCDKDECPAQVRGVCDRLLNAVEASLPTVIFGARDAAGNDLVAVSVRVDGVEAAASLDGKAVPVDPGPHTIVFQREGSTPIEQKAVIRESEKNRSMIVTFPAADSSGAKPIEVAAPSRPVPAVVYILAGVGVASLGVFTGLDVDGQSRYDACKNAGCSTSTVNALSAERDAALAVGGVGLVSLGVATWLFLARPAEPRASHPVTLDVEGLVGGALLGVKGSF